jgi:hypothetical protein
MISLQYTAAAQGVSGTVGNASEVDLVSDVMFMMKGCG